MISSRSIPSRSRVLAVQNLYIVPSLNLINNTASYCEYNEGIRRYKCNQSWMSEIYPTKIMYRDWLSIPSESIVITPGNGGPNKYTALYENGIGSESLSLEPVVPLNEDISGLILSNSKLPLVRIICISPSPVFLNSPEAEWIPVTTEVRDDYVQNLETRVRNLEDSLQTVFAELEALKYAPSAGPLFMAGKASFECVQHKLDELESKSNESL